MKSEPVKNSGVKREFGRVVSHPRRHQGQPFLSGRNIPVLNVLNLIAQGCDDALIVDRMHGKIDQSDIDACRSYQARFLTDTLTEAFQLQAQDNYMMLDENISYLVLYDVVRLFGRSSHVYADGLYWDHNDDELDIWNHLRENRYKVILTSDNDFKRISKSWRGRMIQQYGSMDNAPENLPVVVSLMKNVSREETRDLLSCHQDDIRQYANDNDAAFATITKQGFRKYSLDKDVMRAKKQSFHP